MNSDLPVPRALFVLRWMLVSGMTLGCGTTLGWWLAELPPPTWWAGLRFPPLFLWSSLCLFCGARSLTRAIASVRRERQREFVRRLQGATLWGTLFLGSQVAAVKWLLTRITPDDVQTSDRAMVTVAAALHALHFVVAVSWLVYVTLQAERGRYDHEYFWDVRLCAWFWQALGAVWIAILAVMLLGSIPIEAPGPVRDPIWEQTRRE